MGNSFVSFFLYGFTFSNHRGFQLCIQGSFGFYFETGPHVERSWPQICFVVKDNLKKNIQCFYLLRAVRLGPEEMAQRLRAPTVLLKVLSSNHSNCMVAHNHT